ncbi:MAG TPA: lysophospholipid acyltransferase family protein [Ignavibacteria bacterium]|nr:lysophospholipid acyltransferase family protein [Ignavibacteria bacterium]
MIRAKHNRFAESLYRIYIKRLLKKNFNRFILLNEIPDIPENSGLIVTPNHFSWWDGFFAEFLMRKFTDRRLYILMLEEQLKKFWFFRYLGAFSIKQGSVKSIKESIDYAKEISSSSLNYLVYYPQGRILNYGNSASVLKKGLMSVAGNTNVGILIVSFRIIYGTEKLPDIYCRFCEKLCSVSCEEDFVEYERLFFKNTELLDQNISASDAINIF